MTTEAEAAARLAIETIQGTNGSTFVVRPDHHEIEELESDRDLPVAINETAKLHRLEDWVEYVNLYRTDATIAFADVDELYFSAQLEYHRPRATKPSPSEGEGLEAFLSHEPAPGWNRHTAGFRARHSLEFAAWKLINGRKLSQVEFVRFLEDQLATITEPQAGQVLEVCSNLEAIKKVTFQSAIRMRDGQRQLAYKEEDQALGGVVVPETLKLSVSVFDGQPATEITALLRYRIDDGKLHFIIDLHQCQTIIRNEFDKLIDSAKNMLTGVPILRGELE